MAGTDIIIEDGVIQCEHGGQVILKSTVTNHVIAGKKPLFTKDLLDAPIKDCSNPSVNGGPCTKVVSITSAITESNIAGKGENYLLRTDGCQTDKGVALILVDPGQTQTIVPVKSGGSAGSTTAKELKNAKIETKENIKREKYRIHPLRKSNGDVRGLRGARNFQVLKNFHSEDTGHYTHDKVLTATGAYLYVTHNKEVTEYKVVNRGDFLNPTMHQVQFKDTKTNTIRRYIPFYEETGTLDFVYSNIKLSDDEVATFPSTSLTVEDKKNSCVIHPKVYSKAVKEKIKAFKKKEVAAGIVRAESKTRPYVSTLLYLDDPIGEVEDLYNEYEFSYHRHYGMNKAIIDDIRAKNQYSYAVADMLDYLYVSEKEQNSYKQQRDTLQDQYKVLTKITKEEMADAIKLQMGGNNLAHAVDFKIAKDYFDEINFIDKEFLTDSPFLTLNFKDGAQSYVSDIKYKGKITQLFVNDKKFKDLKNASKMEAMLTFSVCFGDMYKTQRETNTRLKAESEKFYYLLKKANPLPQMNKQSLDDIYDELKHQNEYTNIFSRTDNLLNEFENLDITLKLIAYDPKKAKKERKPNKTIQDENNYGFKSLKSGSNQNEIFYDISLRTPKEITKDISKALEACSEILQKYQAIKITLRLPKYPEEELNYYKYLMNLAYMLMSPRAELDKETRKLSLFNNNHKEVQSLISFLTERLNIIGEEKAQKLHKEPIKDYYLKALYSLIAHAKLEKSDYGKKGSPWEQFNDALSANNDGRENNASALLEAFEQEIPKTDIETTKVMDQNFDKDLQIKTKSEKLYASLKQIDGVTSYLDKINGTLDDEFGGNENKINDFLTNNSKYQKFLASTKALSFLITVGKIVEYAKGKEKLKIHNLIGLAGDTLSASSYIADLAKQSGKEIPLTKSLPKSLEHITKIDKLISPSSMKVIARFGIIGVTANAINELNSIDPEKNEDYFISVALKNSIYIGLLFTPALFALGAIAIIEITWALLSDKIKNSEIELYLYDSLLFNSKEHNKGRVFNKIESDKAYGASIMLETLKTSNGVYTTKDKDLEIVAVNGFTSMKNTREFIANNYEDHSSQFDNSMQNELSRLKAALYGFKLEKENDYNSTRMRAAGISINLNSAHSVKLSKALYDEADEVYLSYTNINEKDNEEKVYEKLSKLQTYDIAGHVALTSKVFETIAKNTGLMSSTTVEKQMWMQSAEQENIVNKMLQDISIIFKSEKVNLKYEIIYHTFFQSANNYAEIENIKAVSLTQDDYNAIKDDNNA